MLSLEQHHNRRTAAFEPHLEGGLNIYTMIEKLNNLDHNVWAMVLIFFGAVLNIFHQTDSGKMLIVGGLAMTHPHNSTPTGA